MARKKREDEGSFEDDILEDWRENVTGFLNIASVAQRDEIYKSYAYMDGHQWLDNNIVTDRRARNKRMVTINLSAPIIYSLSGNEVINDTRLDVVPMDMEFDVKADKMSKMVGYCQYASNWDSQKSIAKKDAAACGIGATVTYLDMSLRDNIAGSPVVERIHPYFMYYDRSVRERDLNRFSRWCGYVDLVYSDDLDDWLESEGHKDLVGSMEDMKVRFLDRINQSDKDKLDIVAHYFWYEYDKIYDIQSPLKNDTYAQMFANDEAAANMVQPVCDELNLMIDAPYWSVNKKDYKKLNDAIEAACFQAGVEYTGLKYSTRNGKCYYRAMITRNKVISWSKSYHQDGHIMVFYQGRFDNTLGYYYGYMRSLSHIQDALNESVSDMSGYTSRVSTGGSAYVKGAADDIKILKKTKANEDDITPIGMSTEIIPKAMPNSVETLMTFINFLVDMMPKMIGLDTETLAAMSRQVTNDNSMAGITYNSVAAINDLANSYYSATYTQTAVFVSLSRVIVNIAEGSVFSHKSEEGEPLFQVFKQDLAARYDIQSTERPVTKNERIDTWNKFATILSSMSPEMQQMVMPVAIKYAPVDYKDRKQLEQLMTPQPPQPDPMNDAMIQANIKLIESDAAHKMAQAETMKSQLPYKPDEIQSVILKNEAAAHKSVMPSNKN